MMNLIKLLLFLTLAGISFQDFIERKVFLWLFILTGFSISILHFEKVYYQQFVLTIIVNVAIIFIIILLLIIYSKIVLKKTIKGSFGLGDFLFFIILGIGFPTATFLVIFSFSLLFSIVLYTLFKQKLGSKTVPLAGLQALFVSFIFTLNWIFNFTNLYTI